MKIFYSNDDTFEANFNVLLERGKMDIEGVTDIVSGLLKEIQTEGNTALKAQIAKFDRWEPKEDAELLVSTDDMAKAYKNIDPEKLRDALHLAYDRIESYHQKLMPKTWMDTEENGTILGQKVTAVDRAGLYIPGGKAAYPSFTSYERYPRTSCRCGRDSHLYSSTRQRAKRTFIGSLSPYVK